MKANPSSLSANAARLDPALKIILLHGPDEANSRDIARQIARQFESDTNPLAQTLIPGSALRDDPAILTTAAAEMSMFGDRTLVRIDDASEDALAAVTALLADSAAGNPVLMVAIGLKKGSKLQTLVENARAGLAHQSYPAEARDAEAIVSAFAAEVGLKPARGVGRMLFDACGGDRGILRSELTKLALFIDASPASPRPLEHADIAAIGADIGDADLSDLVDAVASGRPDLADQQITRLTEANIPGITQLRSVARRFWLLLDLRAAVDAGASPQTLVDGARPPIFWREKPAVTAQITRWRIPAIRAALDRLLETERAIKRSSSAGEIMSNQALLGIASMVARN